MRENNRKSIASIRKLPQFTTMNVIDGQAGQVIYSSLIFYSLTIDNILNIIVLLILAGVSVATLTGESGILTQVNNAKKQTTEAAAREEVEIAYQAALTDLHSGKISQDEVATKLGEELGITVTDDGENYKLNYKGYSMTISKATGKVTVASTDNAENAKKIKWIYEENADGNIEITGIDLSEYGDTYTITDDGYTRSTIISLEKDTLEIPSQIDEKTVVKLNWKDEILPADLKDVKIDIKGVKAIIFGDSIEEISKMYMLKFTEVETIITPKSLKKIGDATFAVCSSLNNINIPNSVTSIGAWTFAECGSLSNINIPNSLTSIGEGAFTGCRSLNNVNIPSSVTSIGYGAFSACDNITLNFNNGINSELTIPENKWGANKIMINGVATTNFTLIPSGSEMSSVESCTYEANIGETWNDWIERNKSVIQSGIAKELFDAKTYLGTQSDGTFDGGATEAGAVYWLKNSSGVTVKTTDIIQPEEDYTLTIEGR